MDEVEKALPEILDAIVKNYQNEIHSLSQDELVKRWYFSYDFNKSQAKNLYEFSKMLEIYRRSCRQWEEHHYGTQCVVERVRDNYLMPKIEEFLKDQSSANLTGIKK